MSGTRHRTASPVIAALVCAFVAAPAFARAPSPAPHETAVLLSATGADDTFSGEEIDVAEAEASPIVETASDVAAPEPELQPAEIVPLPVRRSVVAARPGATLMDILTDAAVPRGEAGQAITALRGVYDPRRLRAGQRVTMLFQPRANGETRFMGLEIVPNPARSFTVARRDDGAFTGRETVKEVEHHPTVAGGEIRTSLYEAGRGAGVPVAVLMEMIRLHSHEVDFQRDLQPGDRFRVMYETARTVDGTVAGLGDVLFASLTLGGKELALYRFENDGRVDHYDRNGESVRRSLLRTPIDGARLTSGFGPRKHPILGYTKQHQGLDFGAPPGTPIYAAGRGVVESVGWSGGYGNYIRLRHDGETETGYGHMSRFAQGLGRGARVDQGEVIGFVGSTGRSTGPHLHYEVLRGGRQIDPRRLDLPTGDKLTGRALAAFRQTQGEIDRLFEDVGERPALVSARPEERARAPAHVVCDAGPGC